MSTIMIRNEKETDYSVVEEITRKAFYNIYVPGLQSIIWFISCVSMRISFRSWIL